MLFIMISAYKSMCGQDRRITLIHMFSANTGLSATFEVGGASAGKGGEKDYF